MGPGIRQAAKSGALDSGTVFTLAVLCLTYYLGAQAAFYVGTLSDRIFAPFWPPNIILFFALLLVPQRRWWLCIAAAFPAHVVAELGVGMGTTQLVVAFVTNCAVAMLNAYGVSRFVVGPDWFGTVRQAVTYVLITVIVSPAVCALGGAFVPLLSNGEIDSYWLSWAHWYGSNALAGATLGPVLMTWSRRGAALALTRSSRVEMALMLAGLFGACALAFGSGAGAIPAGFVPTLLYLPLPFVLWATIRFGGMGASAAIFVVTIVVVWRSLQGATLFDGGNAGQNVLALQAFLTVLSVPVLLLGAAIEQLRRAESRMQALAGGLLRVQDEERREVARQLHDGTGQNLAGASLIASRVHNDAPEPMRRPIRDLSDILQQSVRELRTISHVLHPPLLDELGLALALRSYVNAFSQRSGIAVDLSLPTIDRLPGAVELALFRVIQEALTNIYCDSDSTGARIHVELRAAGPARELALTVEGFGTGARSGIRMSLLSDLAVGSLEGVGLGVQGMHERLRQIGGRLKFDKASGRTLVTATMPLASPVSR
jgi:signal transduction histidine kinase